ncbi:hypothetical protein BDY19DRAFT_972352 [Irpex rosettiformis]|uniref:Uncharacterized protein n=1 Tax=Irpex rosettiformis TaxID=378272 RepID=A0ACB8TQR9_9APHY|nr:hypothetical protein BDY19DRAFT_972352 [Irpex rosettiformis]
MRLVSRDIRLPGGRYIPCSSNLGGNTTRLWKRAHSWRPSQLATTFGTDSECRTSNYRT